MTRIATRTIGAAEVTILTDGGIDFGTELFPGTLPDHIADLMQRQKAASIATNFNAVLIREGGRTVLCDAGPRDLFGPTCGDLPLAMAEAGLDPAQVDTLFATHLHPDHIAGMITAQGAAVFPNAELVVTRAEHAFWSDEAATGAMQIHAYDAVPTVAGQGTLMREWEAQGLDADTILIAVGGGGLIGGALAWLQGRRKVVAVEPMTCNALSASVRAGRRVEVPVSGVAANALGSRSVGEICFSLVQQQATPVVEVTDGAIVEAQKALWQAHRQLVEPAGATALAALMSGAYVPARGERVAVLVCGANPAPDPLA